MADAGPPRDAGRLDNFVDGAFAFSVTLLVIADAGEGFGYTQLAEALWRVPVFAASFALIVLFWHAHVAWRRAGGGADRVSLLLSLALVFTVLVYVYPLRVTGAQLVAMLHGGTAMTLAELAGLFTIYAAGFSAMATLVALLYGHGLRRGELSGKADAPLVWWMMTAAGVGSMLLAQLPGQWVLLAPWTYALLAPAIPLVLKIRSRRRNKIT